MNQGSFVQRFESSPCLRRLVSALLPLALLGIPAPRADAQAAAPIQSSQDRIKQAEKAYQDGLSLVQKEDWAGAERKMLEAWGLNATYDVATNLALIELRLKKNREAAAHFAFALRNWPLAGSNHAARQEAERQFRELRAILGSLTIEVGTPGALVWVAGTEIGVAPLPEEVFVDAGQVVVEARLDGYERAKQVVDAKAGSAQKVTLSLVPVAAVSSSSAPIAPSATLSTQPPVQVDTTAPPMWWGAVTGGVAAASLGVGLALTFASNGASDDANAEHDTVVARNAYCADPRPADAQTCGALHSAAADADMFHDAAIVGYVLSAAALGATGVIVLWPRSDASAGSRGEKAGLLVAPMVGPQGGGATVVGTF